jgi:hypothetical protein
MDSPHEIPNGQLRQEHLPGPDDDQLAWIEFALTFDGYAEKGNHEACAAFANSARNKWEQTGTLPLSLNDLRTALFFEQRRWRWSNEAPFSEDDWRYWRSIVDAIREKLPQEERLSPKQHGVNKLIVDSSAVEQKLDLFSEIDAHGGRRYVWLRLSKERKLILEGQDLGGAVCKVFRSGEYEWAWSLNPEQLSSFLELLGVCASEPDALLESIGAALNVLDRTKIQKMFQDAGATFWSRAGD